METESGTELEITIPTAISAEESGLGTEAAKALEQVADEQKQALIDLQQELERTVAAYSELARRLPGVLPDLIRGATLSEVQTSLASSQLAYSEAMRLAPVSAGGGQRNSTEAPEIIGDERGFSLILQGVQRGRGGFYK